MDKNVDTWPPCYKKCQAGRTEPRRPLIFVFLFLKFLTKKQAQAGAQAAWRLTGLFRPGWGGFSPPRLSFRTLTRRASSHFFLPQPSVVCKWTITLGVRLNPLAVALVVVFLHNKSQDLNVYHITLYGKKANIFLVLE